MANAQAQDDSQPTDGPPISPLGSLASMQAANEAYGGLGALQQTLGSARLPGQDLLEKMATEPVIDPSAKWNAYAAAAISPEANGSAAAGFSGALNALAGAQTQEAKLKAQYAPIIAQAQMQRQIQAFAMAQQALKLKEGWNNMLTGAAVGTLGQPGGVTTQGVQNAVMGRVQAGVVPLDYAQQWAQQFGDHWNNSVLLEQDLRSMMRSQLAPKDVHGAVTPEASVGPTGAVLQTKAEAPGGLGYMPALAQPHTFDPAAFGVEKVEDPVTHQVMNQYKALGKMAPFGSDEDQQLARENNDARVQAAVKASQPQGAPPVQPPVQGQQPPVQPPVQGQQLQPQPGAPPSGPMGPAATAPGAAGPTGTAPGAAGPTGTAPGAAGPTGTAPQPGMQPPVQGQQLQPQPGAPPSGPMGPAATAPGFGVGMDPATAKARETIGNQFGEYVGKLNTQVKAFQGIAQRNDEMRQALQQFQAGAIGQARGTMAGAIKDMMISAGVPPDRADSWVSTHILTPNGNLASYQEFQKLGTLGAMEALTAANSTSGGRNTVFEFANFKQNMPNANMDPAAMENIMNFAAKQYQWASQEQQFVKQQLDARTPIWDIQPAWARYAQNNGIPAHIESGAAMGSAAPKLSYDLVGNNARGVPTAHSSDGGFYEAPK